MFAEYTFTAGGAVYVDEYRMINGYKRNAEHGTYHINGNKIILNLESKTELSNINDIELDSVNTLYFNTKTNEKSGRMQFFRIIGIIHLQVGEKDTISSKVQQAIAAYTSQPIREASYEIYDNSIASIDSTGILVSKMIGVTYLRIETATSNAILKISVSDDGNLWNDFSQGLGKSFYEVESLFGKYHVFNISKSDSIRYFYDTPYVDSVVFYRHDNTSDSIVVSFTEQASNAMVRDYLLSRLTHVKDTLSHYWYTDNDNYLLSTYSAKYHPEQRKLIYTAFDLNWDDRRSDYGLTDEDLEKKYGTPICDSLGIKTYDIVKNDFIVNISFSLKGNPRRVSSYSAQLNIDIQVGMIDDYIQRNYPYYDKSNYEGFKNGKNIQIEGKEMILLVKRNENELRFRFVDNN